MHVEGVWPGLVTLRRGWGKAVARPWNDDITDPTVRLERGSSDFLRSVAHRLAPLGSGSVYSPALYPSATGVWTRAGFEEFDVLNVMECDLGRDQAAAHPAEVWEHPDWSAVVEIDRLAFDGFWRMSRPGLLEALRATPRSAVLKLNTGTELAGYALVGAQMGLSFLQRVAVAPQYSGRGMGSSLVRSAKTWAKGNAARIMVLNLRPENDRARRLYEREGFRTGSSHLLLLRFEV